MLAKSEFLGHDIITSGDLFISLRHRNRKSAVNTISSLLPLLSPPKKSRYMNIDDRFADLDTFSASPPSFIPPQDLDRLFSLELFLFWVYSTSQFEGKILLYLSSYFQFCCLYVRYFAILILKILLSRKQQECTNQTGQNMKNWQKNGPRSMPCKQ